MTAQTPPTASAVTNQLDQSLLCCLLMQLSPRSKLNTTNITVN
ncbi:MAG: hypothetical protein N2B04_04515 [Psychrobacter sp.]